MKNFKSIIITLVLTGVLYTFQATTATAAKKTAKAGRTFMPFNLINITTNRVSNFSTTGFLNTTVSSAINLTTATTNRPLPNTTFTNPISCTNPLTLLSSYEVPSNGVSKFKLTDNLNRGSSIYSPSCYLKRNPTPNMVYTFRINTKMYIDIKMTGLNGSNTLDSILILTDFSCSRELFCSDNDFGKSARIMGNFEPGDYKLTATVTTIDIAGLYELEINFEPDGTCQNPTLINSENFLINPINFFSGFFSPLLKLQKLKMSCAENNSSSIVYGFEISANSEYYVEALAYSFIGNNKLDTVLAITNTSCQTYNNMCNDDSTKVGGLSSHVFGVLPSGKYKMVVSAFDDKVVGSYKLDFILAPVRIGPLSPFRLQNTTNNFTYSGVFSYLNGSLNFNCLNQNIFSNSYMILTLIVPDGRQANTTIELKAANGKNKLDTFIQIRNLYFRNLNDTNACNDDSPLVGGVSSRVQTTLPGGTYRVAIGVFDRSEERFSFNIFARLL